MLGMVLLVVCTRLCPVAADDLDAQRKYLVNGEVVDADTGEPIKTFRVLPGTPYRGDQTDAAVAVWQPHMIREMTDGVFQWPRTRGYKEMRFRVEADGYRPATTNWLGVGGPYMHLKVHLRRDRGVEVLIRRPDGKPAVGATIAIGQPNRGVQLDGYQIKGFAEAKPSRLSDWWRRPQTAQTDEGGRCLVPAETDPVAVLCVAHEDGYLEMPFADFVEQAVDDFVTLKLKRWGQIRGQVYWRDKPGEGESVSATIHRDGRYPGIVAAYPATTADANGDYSMDYIPPGRVQVGHHVKLAEGTNLSPTRVIYEYPIFHVKVRPGQSVTVDIGGKGLVVVGRLAGAESYRDVTIAIQPPPPDLFGWAKFGNVGGGNDLQKGFAALRSSDYAPLYFRGSLPVSADGSFRIEDVMTGKFNLTVSGSASASTSFDATSFGNNPIDLGTIQVKPQGAEDPKDEG